MSTPSSGAGPSTRRAIRIRTDCNATIDLPDGSTKTVIIKAGTNGYLVRDRGDKYVVQLFNDKGETCFSAVPRNVVDVGVPHSQFSIQQPNVRQAPDVGTLASQRASDPAGKAIRYIWDGIQENFGVLSALGLRSHVFDSILNDPTKKREALEIIIASFLEESWKALNTPGLPVNAFRNIPRITDDNKLEQDKALIYLRLYVKDNQFAKYAGKTSRTYPGERQKEHENATHDTTNNSPHYRVARQYPAADRHALPMMILSNANHNIVTMAETTLCYLLQTLHDDVKNVPQQFVNEALSAATHSSLENRMLMSVLHQIVRTALQRSKYPEFGGTGCNWGLPLHEARKDKRQWFRFQKTTQDNRSMLVYRYQSAVTLVRSSRTRKLGAQVSFNSKIDISSDGKKKTTGFEVIQVLENLPGIQKGKPLIFSLELMEDGKPHPTPWYRGPFHGAWSNCHELHSFAMKVEWKDETSNQWYCYPMQPQEIFSTYTRTQGDSTVTNMWRKATTILQFLHNRRYRNPPSFLHVNFRPDIKHVVYDHLTQTVGFKQVPETVMDPPSHVSNDHNIRALGKASETYWPLIKVGRLPEPAWFEYFTAPPTGGTNCLLCRYARSMGARVIAGCSKREGNFHVAADVPGRESILKGSCCLCWEYYRRPCVWMKITDLRPETMIRNQSFGNVMPPPGYEGVSLRERYTGPAIPIQAPMGLEMYKEFEKDAKEMEFDESQVDNEED
ncbi:hypothetical protein FNAPI_12324 [Fusarium napiforme]|uniref:Uncharacterized protein n=1 Tax=Fusarium napiforme TaxID=42672 RepID=A0A8H5IC80_9HYPO|nr:hypothetical protein FNAPI_12324 [Fusarium napiforme]